MLAVINIEELLYVDSTGVRGWKYFVELGWTGPSKPKSTKPSEANIFYSNQYFLV